MSLPFEDAPALHLKRQFLFGCQFSFAHEFNAQIQAIQNLMQPSSTIGEIPEGDAVYNAAIDITPPSISKHLGCRLRGCVGCLGCWYLNMKARPYTLQSPRQCGLFAAEIPIQFIGFDLDKATGLELCRTKTSRQRTAM
jgi:hypothetical protein